MVNGKSIPYHLINHVEPYEQFYLHQFSEELQKAFNAICLRGKVPIICGGTGLYLDALRKDFSFTQIKEDPELRERLEGLSKEELIEWIKKYPADLTQHVDLNSKKGSSVASKSQNIFLKHKRCPKGKNCPTDPIIWE